MITRLLLWVLGVGQAIAASLSPSKWAKPHAVSPHLVQPMTVTPINVDD